MLRPTLFAALVLAGIAPTHAQTAPAAPIDSMVANPCEGLTTPIPEPVLAYMKEKYTAEPGAAARPLPPEALPYRNAVLESAKRDWGNLCKYNADNQRLRAGPAGGRRIVFMGDSITQGWELAHPEFFTGGVVDRGISGQTTPQMLLRFQADVVALAPAIVHIMAGTNDVAGNTGPNSPEGYRNNIMAMVTLAKANGIKVILASIPPASVFVWKPTLKPAPQIAELNAWLRAYAKEQDLVFVDYHSALAAPDGSLRKELTFDGVHPNLAGYQVMEPLTLRAISEAEGKKR